MRGPAGAPGTPPTIPSISASAPEPWAVSAESGPGLGLVCASVRKIHPKLSEKPRRGILAVGWGWGVSLGMLTKISMSINANCVYFLCYFGLQKAS